MIKIMQCYLATFTGWADYSKLKEGTTPFEAQKEVERLRSIHPGHDFKFVK